MQGLLEPSLTNTLANAGAGDIVHAVGNGWPSVIAARPNNIYFIAALRTVFMGPEFTGYGMQGCALNITIAPRERLGKISFIANKRVVRRDTPIVMQAYNRTRMVVAFLSALFGASIAKG